MSNPSEFEELDGNPNQLQLKLLLGDYAVTTEGKLTLVGGGWSQTTGLVPSAVALVAKVPSSWSGQTFRLEITLYDEDGNRVAHAPQAQLEIHAGDGPRPGVPSDFTKALNISPFPLIPNRSYTWRATVDGHTRPEWGETFFVLPTEQQMREAS